jgi:hypothetical protein
MPLIADISNKVSRLVADRCYLRRDYGEPVVVHGKLYDAVLFSLVPRDLDKKGISVSNT